MWKNRVSLCICLNKVVQIYYVKIYFRKHVSEAASCVCNINPCAKVCNELNIGSTKDSEKESNYLKSSKSGWKKQRG